MKIAFLGDIAFFGEYSYANCDKIELLRKFDDAKDLLNGYDAVIGNLETPLTSCKIVCGGKSAYIKGIPEDVELLKYLGVTHVNLANNHMFDFNKQGLEDTIRVLEDNGIDYFGVNNRTCLIKNNNCMINIHGYCCYSTNGKGYMDDGKNLGINILDYNRLEKDLKSDLKSNYFSIISVHWGQEHVNYPNYDHIELARQLSERYPFILHGHHPHVIQGIEENNMSLIAYSLGNFCFDDVYTSRSKDPLIKLSENNRTAFIWAVTVHSNNIVSNAVVPIFIEYDGIKKYNNESFQDNMDNYSSFLFTQKDEYQKVRNEIIKNYIVSRKRARDFRWYIKRLNFESVKMIYAGRNNTIKYNYHIKKQIMEKDFKNERTAVICGNFDFLNQNAAGRRVLGTGLILRDIGYKVFFVGVTDENLDILDSHECKYGFDCFSVKKSVSNASWIRVNYVYDSYLKVFQSIGLSNIELICLYGSPVLSYLMQKIIRFARKNHISVIADCVDWIEKTNGGIIKNLVKYIDTNYQKKKVISKADGVIATSSYLKKYYDKKNLRVVLLPSVGEPYLNETSIEGKKRIKFKYIGRPFPKKANINANEMKDRLDKSIEIFSELKKYTENIQFDIYGIEKDEYLFSVPHHEILLNELDDDVIFHGQVDASEIKSILLDADGTILYRDVSLVTTAGFPTKVSESLCYGIPVISTDTSDICDYVKDGENGIIISMNSAIAAKEIYEKFIVNKKYIIIKKKCNIKCTLDYKYFINDFDIFLQSLKKVNKLSL